MVFLLQFKLSQRVQTVNAWHNKHKNLNTNLSASMAKKLVDLRRKFILCIAYSVTLAYLQVLQQPLGKNVIVP